MKTNKLSFINVGFILFFALLLGAFIMRPVVGVKSAPLLLLFGEEEVGGVKALPVVKASPIINSAKTQVAPVRPQVSLPLPVLPPKITLQILPPYPPLALEQGLSGTTLLSVFIGVSGVPEKVEVRNSSGVAEFDHAATQAVFKWQFSPATQAGVAVASWLDIPVRFEVN